MGVVFLSVEIFVCWHVLRIRNDETEETSQRNEYYLRLFKWTYKAISPTESGRQLSYTYSDPCN